MIIFQCRGKGFEILPEFMQAAQVPPQVASECSLNMKSAAEVVDASQAEKYLKLTAQTCSGSSEWYEALRQHPFAMGFPDVQGNELEILCFNYPDSQACTNP